MLKKLLSTPTEKVGRFTRFVVVQLRLWRHCAVLLRQNHAGSQAAALSYHTIFGIVPMAIVMLLLFQSLHTFRQAAPELRKFIYQHTNLYKLEYPSEQDPEQKVKVVEKIDETVTNVLAKLEEEKGAITAISGVVIIWAALGLLTTIERAFNRIWHVSRGRGWLQRVIGYWTLLTLGPLLVGLGLYLSTRYAAANLLREKIFFDVGPVVTYLVSVLVFFFLYLLMPNAKVSPKAAVWGAALAALVWNFAKWAFGIYVVGFIPYSRMYGIMGLIPLTVLWIYITWLIVLFGLQLTFTTQHLKSLNAAEMAAAKRREEYFLANDFTVINIMAEIAKAFRAKSAPVEAEVVCSKLDLPAEFGEKILEHLVGQGLLVKASEPREGFLPATEPGNIRLSEISMAVANAGFGQHVPEGAESLRQISDSQRETLGQYNLGQIISAAAAPEQVNRPQME